MALFVWFSDKGWSSLDWEACIAAMLVLFADFFILSKLLVQQNLPGLTLSLDLDVESGFLSPGAGASDCWGSFSVGFLERTRREAWLIRTFLTIGFSS